MRPMLGQCVLEVDLNNVINAYNSGWRVVCITDASNDIKSLMPEAIMASVFLPPYDAMELLMDGNVDGFNMVYSEYLYNTQEITMMIDIILAAMYKGINIILYIPVDEFKDINFWSVFSNCLTYTTGIVPACFGNQFFYDVSRNNANMIRLFVDGFINYGELLVYHDGPIYDPNVCIMVCGNIGFITENESEAIQYVNSYKDRIVENNNVFLKKGFIKV